MPALLEVIVIVVISFGFLKGIDNIAEKKIKEKDKTEITK